jgi:4-diphosphocytidyl-2C-methyl-D-erythritol kinase
MQQFPIGQIEGAGEAIKAAAKSGWEAVMLVLVFLAFVGAAGIFAKWLVNSFDKQIEASISREAALATRIAALEDFIHNTLMEVIQSNQKAVAEISVAIRSLESALKMKPCLLNEGHPSELTNQIADAVVSRVLNR